MRIFILIIFTFSQYILALNLASAEEITQKRNENEHESADDTITEAITALNKGKWAEAFSTKDPKQIVQYILELQAKIEATESDLTAVKAQNKKLRTALTELRHITLYGQKTGVEPNLETQSAPNSALPNERHLPTNSGE